jgi:6-phosphogluconolactonase
LKKLFLFAITVALLAADLGLAAANDLFAYFGTYTTGKSKGIYVARFTPSTGAISEVTLAAETPSPSFLAVHPNQQFLYAVNEVANYEGKKAGSVSSFAIDRATGKLKHLNTVSTKGDGPCHLALDKKGKFLAVANYGGGSVAVYSVKPDGTLSEATDFVQHSGTVALPQRQGGPHGHWAGFSPDNKLLLVADLGLDQILVYDLDQANGKIKPHNPPFGKLPPGTGPRHAAFSPNGKSLYVLGEIIMGVTTFRYDGAKGSMEEIQNVPTIPADLPAGNRSGAELMVHPTGKFVYASNRGPNTIAAFRVNPNDGKLTAGDRTPTGGRTPRGFGIDPTGGWLFAANQQSDSVVLFKINPTTGALSEAGKTLEVGTPVNVVFSAAK